MSILKILTDVIFTRLFNKHSSTGVINLVFAALLTYLGANADIITMVLDINIDISKYTYIFFILSGVLIVIAFIYFIRLEARKHYCKSLKEELEAKTLKLNILKVEKEIESLKNNKFTLHK